MERTRVLVLKPTGGLKITKEISRSFCKPLFLHLLMGFYKSKNNKSSYE